MGASSPTVRAAAAAALTVGMVDISAARRNSRMMVAMRMPVAVNLPTSTTFETASLAPTVNGISTAATTSVTATVAPRTTISWMMSEWALSMAAA